MRHPKVMGSRVLVIPDDNETVEVVGHRFQLDQKTGLVLGADQPRTTGIVVGVGDGVDDPTLAALRERMERAKAHGDRVETVRVLWIRDHSLMTTVDGVSYAFLAVPTAAERRECKVCMREKYRNRDEVLAILEDGVTLMVVRDVAMGVAA